jgi:hypothetical protein
MKKLESLKKHLKPGEVYRRADLEGLTNAVDRHLKQLTEDGTLEKLSGGLYYVPKKSVFGKTPAEEQELLKAFLKDDRYLVTSPNDYNSLGVGTTQLYNKKTVYNRKRHGKYQLGNRSFHFVRKPRVPSHLTREFLMVDLLNNLKNLAEDQSAILKNVEKKLKEMDGKKLRQMATNYGTVGTKKFFASQLQ